MAFQIFLPVIEQFVQTDSHIEPKLFVKQREGRVFEVLVGRRESGCWPTSPTLTPPQQALRGLKEQTFVKIPLFKKENLVSPAYWKCLISSVLCPELFVM